jgi:endonuclease YncB( thermonuclease family)
VTRTETAILAGAMAFGLAAALAVADPAPATFSGTASAVDGDTLRVGGVKTRLWGIDAPEGSQTCNRLPPTQRANLGTTAVSWPCGEAATAALRYMLARDPVVTCQAKTTDRYGRTVATCSNSEGDLGARMVATGHAIVYRRYSDAYVDQEAAAKAEKLGIWSGTFTMPEQWRREHLPL